MKVVLTAFVEVFLIEAIMYSYTQCVCRGEKTEDQSRLVYGESFYVIN